MRQNEPFWSESFSIAVPLAQFVHSLRQTWSQCVVRAVYTLRIQQCSQPHALYAAHATNFRVGTFRYWSFDGSLYSFADVSSNSSIRFNGTPRTCFGPCIPHEQHIQTWNEWMNEWMNELCFYCSWYAFAMHNENISIQCTCIGCVGERGWALNR